MSTKQRPQRKPAQRRPAKVQDDLPIDDIEIDFLILADWAETINGKLYIQGGGWDRKLAPSENQPISFAIVAGILIPWHLTNQEHQFILSLETGDGTIVGSKIEGGFSTGRSVKSFPGQMFRTPFAARIALKVPGIGSYRVKLEVNRAITKQVAFYVVNEL